MHMKNDIFKSYLKHFANGLNSKYGGAIIIVMAFIFSRLPYFIWFPLPHISHDTFVYFNQIRNILSGAPPDFSFLPQGFPVLGAVLIKIFSANFSIIVFQNIFLLFVSIVLVWQLYRINNYAGFWVHWRCR